MLCVVAKHGQGDRVQGEAMGDIQMNQNMPASAPVHPWENTSKPWTRIHIDYAGPFMGPVFLIIVDSCSKWIDAYPMKTSVSQATIERLRNTFVTHGLPEICVSDNASCFTSEEFEVFMKKNGIRHVTSVSYHPATNGCAERDVLKGLCKPSRLHLRKWNVPAEKQL